MQFNFVVVLAAMASVATAEVTTVFACASSSAVASGVASPTVGTIGSTAAVTAPTSTGSPITFAGAGNVNGVSAMGMIVAGGLALFL